MYATSLQRLIPKRKPLPELNASGPPKRGLPPLPPGVEPLKLSDTNSPSSSLDSPLLAVPSPARPHRCPLVFIPSHKLVNPTPYQQDPLFLLFPLQRLIYSLLRATVARAPILRAKIETIRVKMNMSLALREHLPLHPSPKKKRKYASPNHFRKAKIRAHCPRPRPRPCLPLEANRSHILPALLQGTVIMMDPVDHPLGPTLIYWKWASRSSLIPSTIWTRRNLPPSLPLNSSSTSRHKRKNHSSTNGINKTNW